MNAPHCGVSQCSISNFCAAFVSVVDAGGFTRPASGFTAPVHGQASRSSASRRPWGGRCSIETQGTIPTEEGERLLSTPGGFLPWPKEARDVVSRPTSDGIVRLGIPRISPALRLTSCCRNSSGHARGLRLDVRCDLSVKLQHDLDPRELDAAL